MLIVLGSLLLLGDAANAVVVRDGRIVARTNNRFAFDDVARRTRRRGVKINNLDLHQHSTSSIDAIRGGGRDNVVTDVDPSLSFKDQTSLSRIALGSIIQSFLLYTLASQLGKINTSSPLRALALVAIVFGSSYFGSFIDMIPSAATRQVLDPNNIPGNADWYASLKKPRWNPPGWIFPIMWLIVSKPTQFAAVWRLVNYCHHNNKNRPTTTCNDDATMGLSIPLLAYSIHLSLGDAWNKVFFGTESTGRGLAVISAFWTVLWSTAYLFYRVDTISGLLLLPTCLWVTVAALLNLSIYRLN